MSSAPRILIFVEDPGAANFVAPLLDGLAYAGANVALIATGPAAPYLAERGVTAGSPAAGATAAACLQATDLLVVGTSENRDTFAFDLIAEARRAGITSAGVIDGPANAEHRLRGHGSDALAHMPDWLLLTDDWTADRFAALGFQRDRLVVTGHPHHDAIREIGQTLRAEPAISYRQRLLPEAKDGQPVIVFLGEGSDGLGLELKRRSADYTLHGWGQSDRRTEIALEEFLDTIDTLGTSPYLVFRAHPKDDPAAYATYLERFDTVSAGGQPLPLLCASDLVVGLSTSLLDEAALIGLNTLSILPSDSQRALSPSVRLGLTPCATDRWALHELLPRLLAANDSTKRTTDEMFLPGATARVIETLERLCGAAEGSAAPGTAP